MMAKLNGIKLNIMKNQCYILNKYVSVDKPGPKKTVFPAPFEYLEYLERDLKDYPGTKTG